jgi:murein DD-endopeptidase MepM/ murein hydrolase activator NlpD
MAGEDTPGLDPLGRGSHRPLPSVDIPIFRDDVARSRKSRALWGAVAGASSAVTLIGLALLPRCASTEPEAPPPPSSAAVPLSVGYVAPVDAGPPPRDAFVLVTEPTRVETTPSETRSVHTFGSAAGFRPALTSTGMSGADADAIVAALDDVMDFRRCGADDEMILVRDASGTLTRFEYHASITQIYEAVRTQGEVFEGRQIEVPIDTTRIARGGTVTSSLGAALDAAGLGRSLVGTFADVFEGRINFDRETRAGDAFRVLVDQDSVHGTFLRWSTVWAIEYRSQRRGVLTAFWFVPRASSSETGRGDFYDTTGRQMHGGWLRTPLHYDHISSPFDMHRMHPVLHRVMPHNGIDFAAGTGTPVWAAADGTITFAGDRGPNGNLITIAHEGDFESCYAHLSRFAAGIHRGQEVHQRDVIGYVGSTGRSTGPHLHFGLKHHGLFMDPARELNGQGRMLPAGQLGRYRSEMAELQSALAAVVIPDVAQSAATDAPAAPAEDAMD